MMLTGYPVEDLALRASFVAASIETVQRVAGRLALWARRLVGEALGQAQRVAAERESLARLLVGDAASQLGDVGRMFAALADAHAARMAALGLADCPLATDCPVPGPAARLRAANYRVPKPTRRASVPVSSM